MKHKKSIQRFLVLSLVIFVGANLQAGIFKPFKKAGGAIASGVTTATSTVVGGVKTGVDKTVSGVKTGVDKTVSGVQTGVDKTVGIAYGVAGQERPEDKDLEAPSEDEFAWLLEE